MVLLKIKKSIFVKTLKLQNMQLNHRHLKDQLYVAYCSVHIIMYYLIITIDY